MAVARSLDMRVSLALLTANALAITLVHSEVASACLLGLGCLWLAARGKTGRALKFAALALVLYGAASAIAGVRQLSFFWLMLNLCRHFLAPLCYADGLLEAPTGTLLVVAERLHVPRTVGVSLAVFARFLPTISQEYRAIRASLKFRDVGTSVLATLRRPARNFELTIVPLLIRITHVADELSAAAAVRGVSLEGRSTSYDEVSFTRVDALVTMALFAAVAGICVADRLVLSA